MIIEAQIEISFICVTNSAFRYAPILINEKNDDFVYIPQMHAVNKGIFHSVNRGISHLVNKEK